MIFQKENERNLDIQSFVSAFVICKRFFSEGKHEEFMSAQESSPSKARGLTQNSEYIWLFLKGQYWVYATLWNIMIIVLCTIS